MSRAQFAIVVDIDGTLSDNRHREHFAQNKEWEAFHAALSADQPFEDVARLVRLAHINMEIVLCTGRNEAYRQRTLEWLRKHDIPHDCLLMRPDFDWGPDTEIKPKLLRRWHNETRPNREIGDRVVFILEDRDKMVEAWREIGFNCWQVRLGGY